MLENRKKISNDVVKKEISPIIETIKKVMPTTVTIVVLKKLEEVEHDINRNYPEGFGHPNFNIPPEKVDASGMVQVGGGSGFIIDASGIILTNKHVVNEPFAEYIAITEDGAKFKAEILARDPMDDIAILKINPEEKKLVPATLDDETKLELGQTVLAFGNAMGIFRSTVSKGIISGLSRSIEAKADPEAPAQEMRGLIQTDAAINPGNSGGPLTDIFGRVIGITTAIIGSAQNISFAIPIQAAKRDLEDIKKYGKIKRPLLGVRYLTITPDIKAKLNLPVEYGALVIRENPLEPAIAINSPADTAGLREKDIILKWNHGRITGEKNIQDYLENATVGEVVSLTILRGKREIEKRLTLTERR